MIIGHAGQPWAHDDFLAWPRDVAKDSEGNIWVVFNYAALKEFDSSGNLLQIFPEMSPGCRVIPTIIQLTLGHCLCRQWIHVCFGSG